VTAAYQRQRLARAAAIGAYRRAALAQTTISTAQKLLADNKLLWHLMARAGKKRVTALAMTAISSAKKTVTAAAWHQREKRIIRRRENGVMEKWPSAKTAAMVKYQ
jgi:hypothetical protein